MKADEFFLSWEVINIFHIERTKVENGCDCWGRLEYDDAYEVYYNDEFICCMSSNPTVLVNKINDILIVGGEYYENAKNKA